MTHEEMERMMQFILEQQAQLVASQQSVEERATRLEKNVADLAINLSGVLASVSQLAGAQTQLAGAQTQLVRVVTTLAEAQLRTEEKLDAFIGVLERYISEGRNGGGGAGHESSD